MGTTPTSRSRPPARRAWVNVAIGAWVIGAVTLVSRSIRQGDEGGAGITPIQLPAYAGLAALAFLVVAWAGGAVRRNKPWRSAFAGGYELLPLGFVLLLAYTAVDLIWARLFGQGFGIEGSLAPSRLLLAIGLFLVAIGPARAALARAPDASLLAGTLAVGLALVPVTFPLGGLHPLVGDTAAIPGDSVEDDSEVWVMAADGSSQTRVIEAGDGTEVSLPVWSPDGSRIAYTQWTLGTDGQSQGDVWVADADGANAAALAATPVLEWIPNWTPDGAWITYTSDPVPAPGASAVPAAGGPRPGDAPGTVPATQAAGQMWAVRPDGSDRHQVTDTDGGVLAAVTSPDGSRIVYTSDRTGDSEIYTAAADGSDERRLTTDGADDWSPSWSRDGSRIVFTSTRAGGNDIFSMAADGTDVTRLTSDGADDVVPVWSPAEDRIAFVSTRSGDAEIWTMAPDGSDLRNLTRRPSADDGRWSVTWSGDGRSLVYASAGFPPIETQPIVLEDLAIGGIFLAAAVFALGAMAAVAIGMPFGAVTIVLGVGALFAAFVADTWRLIPALVGVGLVIDLVLTRVRRDRRRTVAATLTAAGLVLGYGLTLLVLGSLAWTTTLLIGVGIAAGLIGWILGTLVPDGAWTTPPADSQSPSDARP